MRFATLLGDAKCESRSRSHASKAGYSEAQREITSRHPAKPVLELKSEETCQSMNDED